MKAVTNFDRLALARAARSAKSAERKAHGGVMLRACPSCGEPVADRYMRVHRECPNCCEVLTSTDIGRARILKFYDGTVPK